MKLESNHEVSVFRNPVFGPIRIIQENGSCLFCGSDVAKAFGYSNTSKALTDHCRGLLQNSTDEKNEIDFPKRGCLSHFLL